MPKLMLTKVRKLPFNLMMCLREYGDENLASDLFIAS